MHRIGDFWGGIFFALLGIGAAIMSYGYDIGNITAPEPGFFPFVCGIAMFVLSAIFIIHTVMGLGEKAEGFGDLRRPATLIMGLVAYTLLLGVIGYAVATTLVSVLILRTMGTKSWWQVLAVALFMSLGSYFLFDRLLDVPLPDRILDVWR